MCATICHCHWNTIRHHIWSVEWREKETHKKATTMKQVMHALPYAHITKTIIELYSNQKGDVPSISIHSRKANTKIGTRNIFSLCCFIFFPFLHHQEFKQKKSNGNVWSKNRIIFISRGLFVFHERARVCLLVCTWLHESCADCMQKNGKEHQKKSCNKLFDSQLDPF